MKNLLIIFLIFIASIHYVSAEGYPKSRPNESDGPTIVKIAFYIIDIENIDNKKQSFTADVIIRLKWKDSRLSGIEVPIPLNAIWNPKIQIYNLRDVDARFPEVVKILKGDTIQYTQRYYATLSSPLDFSEFPFDVQTLPITLLSFGFTPQEVVMDFETAGGADKFSVSDWNIEKIGAKTSIITANFFQDGSEVIERPRLDYEFKANRHIQYYWWKVLSPLMVILFLSWAVFWIDPSQVGAQVGVSGTSILTLIAFLYKLDNILPPVSYLTHLDNFVFTTLGLVFFAYIEALVSTTYALNGKKDFALKLDYIFRIAYPIIFIIILLVFWVF